MSGTGHNRGPSPGPFPSVSPGQAPTPGHVWRGHCWRAVRDRPRSHPAQMPAPPDPVLLIGETGLERGRVAIGHMAGFLPAARHLSAAEA